MKRGINVKYGFFVCLLYWIVLSEKPGVEGIVIGTFICLMIVTFNKEINGRINLKKIRLMLLYLAVLLKEIIISNIHVAKIVLGRELRISPTLIKFKTGIKSDLNRVLLANSITLTPGTLTIILKKDELLVHCLEEKLTDGVKNSNFEKIIMKVEE